MRTEALLDIDQVNQLTGLPQATLRNWEKRYGFPQPQRTQGGHRLYGVEDVRKIREVVNLHKNGTKVREAIEQVLSGDSPQMISHTLTEVLRQILEALYRYDVASAEEQLSRIGMRLSETDLLEMVYPKLLIQVGEDWEHSRINVAQEHFSWSFLRTRLLNYFKTGRNSAHQPKVLLATPPEELHEGGLIVLAAYLMLKGWNVYYLGVNLPLKDLLHATETIQPDVVCLSAVSAANIQKNWMDFEALNKTVVVGGQCLPQLKLQSLPASSQIFLVDGDVLAAVGQIELLIQSLKRSVV